jgi:hypothetical protein
VLLAALLDGIVLKNLAIIERAQAGPLDRLDVHEHVWCCRTDSALRPDKSVSLIGVEPLHSASHHIAFTPGSSDRTILSRLIVRQIGGSEISTTLIFILLSTHGTLRWSPRRSLPPRPAAFPAECGGALSFGELAKGGSAGASAVSGRLLSRAHSPAAVQAEPATQATPTAFPALEWSGCLVQAQRSKANLLFRRRRGKRCFP